MASASESVYDEKLLAENSELKKSLAQSNKQVEEMRRKTIQMQDDTKKLERALTKELGDGQDVDQVPVFYGIRVLFLRLFMPLLITN
jgi:hypothetical protein